MEEREFNVDGIEYRHPNWFDEPGVDNTRCAVELAYEHECWPGDDCDFWMLSGDVDEVAFAAKMPSRAEHIFTTAYQWTPGDPVLRFGGVS